ncbi:hypothetical protein IT072_15390 [Leifsonia sp. ZF2019]|uniref:hypothetical protein n=1 Tax=Leifsonia sp. ZF2019 TaxID=2781978 RepID=UPI001CBEDB63|nr:hypothetical protein [Leifsonia sp. ZF2019]UAJ78612.1 hypothetical protein IT072_15390 [Leifsonia sp. ZF2019]
MTRLTQAQKRERQQAYNRRSQERKSRRRALQDAAMPLLEESAPAEPYARIVYHLARGGDAGALRLWAIVTETLEVCGGEVDLRAVDVIAAAHDY